MPAVVDPVLWRSHPHSISEYLVVLKPDVVFSASVNQALFTYPLVTITYDNVTVGAYTDIQNGQLVRIRTSGGEIKGYSRVRKTPTASLLYLATIGQGDIDVADNDLIDVLDDYRPQGKIPRIDAANPQRVKFYKDYDLAYSDQGDEPPPICNAGPFVAKFVDPDTGVITVPRDLTNSFAVAPSATISSYSGDIVDGTVISGSIASGVFTATFPAGKRWCSFSVTDSNGKTHTKHILIVACERTGVNAPIRIVSKSLQGTLADGWTAGFTLLADDVSDNVVVQGALVLYFVEETYDYTNGSIGGYTGCEHVHFVGWITTVVTGIQPEVSDIDISCAGPIGLMRTLPGFSQSISNSNSPNNWNKIKSLTLFRYIWYLLYWHTTVLDICDIEAPDWIASYPYSRFDSDQANPYEIADAMANAVTAKLTCDRNGIFYLRKNPLYMTDEDRDDVPIIISLQAADWKLVHVEEREQPPNLWLRTSALIAQTGKPVPLLAISPGVLPGYGAMEDTFDKQLVVDQADLNIRAGHVYAERIDRATKLDIGILTGGMIADPAWREWVRITLGPDTNRRGIGYENLRIILTNVDVDTDVEAGATEETWTTQHETSGVPAVTQRVPTNDSLNPILMPPLLDIPVIEPLTPIFNGNITLAQSPATYAWTLIALGRRRRDAAGWERVYLASEMYENLGGARIITFRLDPWDPKNTAVVAMHAGVNTGARLVQLSNLDSSTPSISNLLTVDILSNLIGSSDYYFGLTRNGCVDLSINATGFIGVNVIGYSTGGSWFVYRRNRDDVWHATKVSPVSNNNFEIAMGHHAPSPTSGRIYVGAPQPLYAGYGLESQIALSTDMGQTWSLDHSFTGLGVSGPNFCTVHMPYQNNNSDLILYAGAQSQIGGPQVNSVVRRNTDGSYTNITPQVAGDYFTAVELTTFTYDLNQVMMIGVNSSPTSYLFLSIDGGSTWTTLNNPAGGVPTWIGGWPNDGNVLFAVAVDGHMYVTENLLAGAPGSVVWSDFTADFYTVVEPSVNDVLALVPVWVN